MQEFLENYIQKLLSQSFAFEHQENNNLSRVFSRDEQKEMNLDITVKKKNNSYETGWFLK